jgi:hypothetical protein
MPWPLACQECGSSERQGFRFHDETSTVTQTCYEPRCHFVRRDIPYAELKEDPSPRTGYTYERLAAAQVARKRLIEMALSDLRDARALAQAYPPDYERLSYVINDLEELVARMREGAM